MQRGYGIVDDNWKFQLPEQVEKHGKMPRYDTEMQRQTPRGNIGALSKEGAHTVKSPEAGGIGPRIRFMRGQRNLTLDALATVSGLTKSFVSKVERGKAVPSISTAMKLAESLGVTVGQLVGEDHASDAICVVRKNERGTFVRGRTISGYNYELIAGPKRFKRMEPYIMKPPLKFQDDRLFEHIGEEFMFVLSGRVEVTFPGRQVFLSPGDALYFDSHLPHRSRSLGKKNAEVLVVITGSPEHLHEANSH